MVINNNIIDGRKLALEHQKKVAEKISKLKVFPKMVSLLIGSDPPSVLYTNMKQKKAQEVGIDFKALRIPVTENYENVVELIKKLNQDPEINGIMIQLPVPEEFLNGHSQDELLNLIDGKKDVDGLTRKGKFLPAVVRAVMEILEDEKVKLQGKNAVVLGASKLVGLPIFQRLSQKNAIAKICDKNTPNQKELIKKADILVSATGVVHLIKGDMVKEGVVVIDVGAEKVQNRIVGDVEFSSVAPMASKITPVPGGVGPMTVICLMENVADSMEH